MILFWIICLAQVESLQSIEKKETPTLFSSLLSENTVLVKIWSRDLDTDAPLAVEEELISFDEPEGRWQIEKSRFVFRSSETHPVWVELFKRTKTKTFTVYQDFYFNDEHAIAQPPRLSYYDSSNKHWFRSLTPFFGPYSPAASDFDNLVKLLAAASPVRENQDGGFLLSGEIAECGTFELVFQDADLRRARSFKATLVVGDKITNDRRLGYLGVKEDEGPRKIVRSVSAWTDLVFEEGATGLKLVSCVRTTTTFRKDGTESRVSSEIEFDYLPKREVPESLAWSNPFLKIENGKPVEIFPVDNRRFEFWDGQVVMVVDKKSAASIESVTPVDPNVDSNDRPLVTKFFIFVIVVVIAAVVLVFYRRGY